MLRHPALYGGMMRRLLDWDPFTRIRAIFHTEDDDEFVVESREDVTELLEANKARYAQHDRPRFPGEMHLAATVPPSVYYGKVDPADPGSPRVCDLPEKEFKRWLDSPDRRVFRVRPGRLA